MIIIIIIKKDKISTRLPLTLMDHSIIGQEKVTRFIVAPNLILNNNRSRFICILDHFRKK